MRRGTLSRFAAASSQLALVAGALALGAPPRVAFAAPNDGYAMSNDAALRGGAALVLGRDAASVWYNPAAVAATKRFRFDASASAYGLKITRVESALEVGVGDDVRRRAGRENQAQVVPAAASFAFGWPQYHLALGLNFHTPVYADAETRVGLRGRSGDGRFDFEQESNAIASVRRHHFGATLAWETARRFRFGVTVGGLYDKNISFARSVSRAGDESTGSADINVGVDAASRVAGIETVAGVQAKLTRHLHAGASVRTPAGVVWRRVEGGQTDSVARRDETGTKFIQTADDALSADVPAWLTPWTVAAGLALKFHKTAFELDAEASPAKEGVGELWRRRGVWNLRFGGSHEVVRRLILGGGVFTDRTTRPPGGVYPTVVLHRWGGSLAGRLRTPVRLHKSERVGEIVFETTIALRYAYGVGTAGNVRTTYPDSGPNDAVISIEGESRATQHLLTLHVGTGMNF